MLHENKVQSKVSLGENCIFFDSQEHLDSLTTYVPKGYIKACAKVNNYNLFNVSKWASTNRIGIDVFLLTTIDDNGRKKIFWSNLFNNIDITDPLTMMIFFTFFYTLLVALHIYREDYFSAVLIIIFWTLLMAFREKRRSNRNVFHLLPKSVRRLYPLLDRL